MLVVCYTNHALDQFLEGTVILYVSNLYASQEKFYFPLREIYLSQPFFLSNGIKRKNEKYFFNEKGLKRPLHFGLPLEGKCINRKKLNMWTF